MSVNRVNIASDNGLSPIRRQAIIWANAGLLSNGPLGTKSSEILIIKIQTFSSTKMHLKISSAKWRPNAFSWMKMLEFRLNVHWSVFQRVQFTTFQHWFRWWFGADQATSPYLKQWCLVCLRIYASLGLNELKHDGCISAGTYNTHIL